MLARSGAVVSPILSLDGKLVFYSSSVAPPSLSQLTQLPHSKKNRGRSTVLDSVALSDELHCFHREQSARQDLQEERVDKSKPKDSLSITLRI